MNRCKTKYPLMLLHGIGGRDRTDSGPGYWGLIPHELVKEGAIIYYGHQDGWATIESNGYFLKKRIEFLSKKKGYEKFNIIAHSKGGLEARYLASTLNMGDRIASITTIATPHHGSKTMNKIDRTNYNITSKLLNKLFKMAGDKNPNYKKACHQLTTESLKIFNKENKDVKGVFYRSYSSLMNSTLDDFLLIIPHLVVNHFDGVGDGMVSISSAVWTNYKGMVPTTNERGISHSHVSGMLRTRKRKPHGNFDKLKEFYINIVEELKEKGL